jgi:hypothetical protein
MAYFHVGKLNQKHQKHPFEIFAMVFAFQIKVKHQSQIF